MIDDVDAAANSPNAAGGNTYGNQRRPDAEPDAPARLASCCAVPQGSDRRYPRCLTGWADGGHHRDDDADEHRNTDGAGGHDRWRFGQFGPDGGEQRFQACGDADTTGDTDSGGDGADEERLAEDRASELPGVGADRTEERKLTGPLTEHDGKRVVDDEDRDEQRDSGETQQDVPDDVDRVVEVGPRLGLERCVVDHVSSRRRCREPSFHHGSIGAPVERDHDGVVPVGPDHGLEPIEIELHQGGAEGCVVGTEAGEPRQGDRDRTGGREHVVGLANVEAVVGGRVEIHREVIGRRRRLAFDHREVRQTRFVDPAERELRRPFEGDLLPFGVDRADRVLGPDYRCGRSDTVDRGNCVERRLGQWFRLTEFGCRADLVVGTGNDVTGQRVEARTQAVGEYER